MTESDDAQCHHADVTPTMALWRLTSSHPRFPPPMSLAAETKGPLKIMLSLPKQPNCPFQPSCSPPPLPTGGRVVCCLSKLLHSSDFRSNTHTKFWEKFASDLSNYETGFNVLCMKTIEECCMRILPRNVYHAWCWG